MGKVVHTDWWTGRQQVNVKSVLKAPTVKKTIRQVRNISVRKVPKQDTKQG